MPVFLAKASLLRNTAATAHAPPLSLMSYISVLRTRPVALLLIKQQPNPTAPGANVPLITTRSHIEARIAQGMNNRSDGCISLIIDDRAYGLEVSKKAQIARVGWQSRWIWRAPQPGFACSSCSFLQGTLTYHVSVKPHTSRRGTFLGL